MPEHALVLLDGLLVRPEGRGAAGGHERVAGGLVAEPGRLCVVGTASRVGPGVGVEGLEDPPVEGDPAQLRHLLDHRQPRELVAEHQRVALELEHAGAERLVEPGLAAGRHRGDQGQLGPWPGQRDHLETVARVGRQPRGPRQHGVVHAPRDALPPAAITSVT